MFSLGRRGLRLFTVGNSTVHCGFIGQNTSATIRCFSSAKVVTYDEESQLEARSLTVSYLINSCGLSPEDALNLSKRVHFKSLDNPDSMIGLLRDHGFTNAHISKLVKQFPKVLLGNVETFLPKLEFFRSVGVSGADLAHIMSHSPAFLLRSLNKQIIPSYNILKSVLSDNAQVVKVLKLSRNFFDLEKRLEPNISALKRAGVTERHVFTLLRSHPDVLCGKSEKFNQSIKKAIDMGFNPSSMPFLNALVTFLTCPEEAREQRMETFRKWGWSENELISAFKRLPRFTTLSLENINGKMDFIVNKMGWKPSDVAKVPAVLCYSLERKIMPRCLVYKTLVSRGLFQGKVSLIYLVAVSNKSFMENFVSRYKEKVPEITDIYEGKIGFHELGF